MADLAGGTGQVLAFAKKYVENGNNQAALELSGHLLRLEPSNNEAKSIRIQALQALGRKEENANARHYYLTEALETKKGKPVVIDSKITPEQLSQFPLDCFFAALSVNLNAQASADMVKTIGIRFTDENREFSIYIRRGIAEIRHGLPTDWTSMRQTNGRILKAMLAKIKYLIITLAGFNYEKGNAISFGNIFKDVRTTGSKSWCFSRLNESALSLIICLFGGQKCWVETVQKRIITIFSLHS